MVILFDLKILSKSWYYYT